ncbi:MAG TPA: hypothetical protein VMW16_11900 [Sedimentisphaerales bacterium]|nr:hypothetical protein [Sedimentisphaerales bacterium]
MYPSEARTEVFALVGGYDAMALAVPSRMLDALTARPMRGDGEKQTKIK